MKRSRSIRLVLIGSVSVGALAGCGPSGNPTALSEDSFYTNNYYVQGIGYYHAPFRAWYSLPYNYYDARQQRYFFGGRWAFEPHSTITNISCPTEQTVKYAQAQRTDVPRGGFGSTSHHHSIIA